MEKKRNTKEAYLLEALRLFAERGYDSVGVVEIAKAVGCTTSALYKHYNGKRALFDAIVARSSKAFRENMQRLQLNFASPEADRARLAAMTEEGQIVMLRTLFEGIAVGEYPRLFRKLITVEQFRHPELAAIYEEHYVKAQLESFEALMRIWIEAGVMRDGDARCMALQYFAPLVLLIGICDREPERSEEVFRLMEDHVRQFNRAYRTGGGEK